MYIKSLWRVLYVNFEASNMKKMQLKRKQKKRAH